jgi:hypothetical protein
VSKKKCIRVSATKGLLNLEQLRLKLGELRWQWNYEIFYTSLDIWFFIA